MDKLGRILRTVALALLFGGGTATVIAAVTLVNAAKAQGVEVQVAAAANAPVFFTFAKVALGAAVALLLGESMDYAVRRVWNKLTIAQYVSSLLCVGATMVFSLGIVPPMQDLMPSLKTSEESKREFHQLHEVSRGVFGGVIALALVSLILPVFGALPVPGKEVSESA